MPWSGATGIDDEQSLDGIELDNGLVQFEDAKEDQKQQQSSHSTDAEEDDVELNDVQVDQQGAKSQKSAQETNPANNSKGVLLLAFFAVVL